MIPLRRWLREDLREMTHDMLENPTAFCRQFMSAGTIATILADHQSGKRNYADHIYALLMLELWTKRHA
jgi:asparagine synthase (glutamine-hydrolysing)